MFTSIGIIQCLYFSNAEILNVNFYQRECSAVDQYRENKQNQIQKNKTTHAYLDPYLEHWTQQLTVTCQIFGEVTDLKFLSPLGESLLYSGCSTDQENRDSRHTARLAVKNISLRTVPPVVFAEGSSCQFQ